jgi:TPR repeat protein
LEAFPGPAASSTKRNKPLNVYTRSLKQVKIGNLFDDRENVAAFMDWYVNCSPETIGTLLRSRLDSLEDEEVSEQEFQMRIRYFLVGEIQRIFDLPEVLFKIVSRACHGSEEDQFTVGFLLDKGPSSLSYIPPEAYRYVVPSSEEALFWYGLAAHQGHISAMYNMGVIYLRDRPSEGKGSKKTEALRWFLMAGDDSNRDDVEVNKETISQSLFYAGMIILLYMPDYGGQVREESKEDSCKEDSNQSSRRQELALNYLEKAGQYGNKRADAMIGAILLAQAMELPPLHRNQASIARGTTILSEMYEAARDAEHQVEFFKWDPLLLHNMAVVYAKGLDVNIDIEKAKDLLIQAGESMCLEGREKAVPQNLRIKFYKV